MPAHYINSVPGFLEDDSSLIVGALSQGAAQAGFVQQLHTQTLAWEEQINILKQAGLPSNGYLLLEYPIPRRGKRIDCVLLIDGIVYVLEFKIGSRSFFKEDIRQVEDYCLDLRDFHKESRELILVPIIVASLADQIPVQLPNPNQDVIWPVQYGNQHNLRSLLATLIDAMPTGQQSIDPQAWNNSSYSPTPTIIETAQTLYAGQNVHEITRSHAGAANLTTTSMFVIDTIERARASGEKVICFITGVPGSGKTLAGLNIVHSHELHEGELGVFLSGNGPLVKVLQEALARDKNKRTGETLKSCRREVSTFVQNVHHFLDAHFADSDEPPPDQIVIFDEAQRAWNREHSYRKFKRDCSEPEMMLQIMDRHEDWAVIVGLIGGGQEINTGEAGLSEWGRTLEEKFRHWKIVISPQLKVGHHATGGQCLFDSEPEGLSIGESEDLHLKVSVRSYKAEKLNEFVEAVLSCESDLAANILADDLNDYPIAMARSLDTAKTWLKEKQRGTRRIGILASSGARRIKAYGFDVKPRLDVTNWLLNPPEDVRSSFYLEDVATEFDIQGLELDWTCVCWGADFRYSPNGWIYKAFKGTKWQNVNNPEMRQYVLNKYRVLLTRAREGMIIWVPKGSSEDETRKPEFYDDSANFLLSCGIPEV